MGIFSNGLVFGLRLSVLNNSTDVYDTVYEKIWTPEFSQMEIVEKIKQIEKDYHDKFSSTDELSVHFYTEIDTTYEPNSVPYLGWWRVEVPAFMRWLKGVNEGKSINFLIY